MPRRQDAIVDLRQASGSEVRILRIEMKKIFFVWALLFAMVGVAKPTLSYVTESYVHDEAKVSGFPSAGSLTLQAPALVGKHRLAGTSVVHKIVSGKVGETVKCPIVIDDADGIEQIEGFSFSVKSAFKPKDLSVSFIQDAPIKKGQRSSLCYIQVVIPEKVVSLEYTIVVNGCPIILPMSLIGVSNE